jgi:hypothetical protein
MNPMPISVSGASASATVGVLVGNPEDGSTSVVVPAQFVFPPGDDGKPKVRPQEQVRTSALLPLALHSRSGSCVSRCSAHVDFPGLMSACVSYIGICAHTYAGIVSAAPWCGHVPGPAGAGVPLLSGGVSQRQQSTAGAC